MHRKPIKWKVYIPMTLTFLKMNLFPFVAKENTKMFHDISEKKSAYSSDES